MFNSCLLSSFILVWLWPNWSYNYFYTLPAIIISLTSLIQFDQILTLQASNLTSEDLTLTVLAPASFTSPSVVSLNSPTTPKSPFVGFAEFLARVNGERSIGSKWKRGFNSIIKKKGGTKLRWQSSGSFFEWWCHSQFRYQLYTSMVAKQSSTWVIYKI